MIFLFVCLHLTSLLNIGVISRLLVVVIYFDQCAATHDECHAADTGHDTPPRHSIQTWGRPVTVLFNYVERHTEIHSYPFLCLR